MRVSVRSARCVIVLGASRRPQIADANAITTCSALRCLPEGHKLSRSTLVVAELNLLQNVSVARQARPRPRPAARYEQMALLGPRGSCRSSTP